MVSKDIFENLSSLYEGQSEYLTLSSGIVLQNREVRFSISPLGFPALVVPIAPTRETGLDLGLKSIRGDIFNGNSDALEKGSFLRLELQDHQLLREFSFLVDDIVDSLQVLSELPHANRILDTVQSWKQLLSGGAAKKTDLQLLIGTYGELLLLEKLTSKYGPTALDYWQGYEKSRHDFVSDIASVEVKTTLARESFWVTIHGAHQLDASPLGLLGIKLEKSPKGRTLTELVEDIAANGLQRVEILSRLKSAGIEVLEGSSVNSESFEVLYSKYCVVDELFPKIVPQTLKQVNNSELIQNLSYQVNISPIAGSEGDIAFDEAVNVLKGFSE